MSIQLVPTNEILEELRRRYPRIVIILETQPHPVERNSIRVVATGSIIEALGLVTYADTVMRLQVEKSCQLNFPGDVF